MEDRFFASGYFLLLISSFSLVHEGRRPETPVKVTPVEFVLNYEISAFDLNNETIEVGLKRLASRSAAFAMGFEHELKSKQTDPPIQDPRLTLHLTATTVREALDAMCHADGRYTWSTDDAFVNVYPIKTISDASYLMNRRLEKLDLKELTQVDSSGVGIIVGTYVSLRRQGGDLKLLCPSDRVLRVLTVFHLLSIIESFEDEARAVASFRPADNSATS